MAVDHYDIFISYRTTYREWVHTLATNLKNQGYKIFLDAWELVPGKDFANALYQGLNHSRCAILVATPDAAESGWVQEEYSQMLRLKNNRDGFFFIPVIFGRFPDFPFVGNVQAVDFGTGGADTYRQAFYRLLCGLEEKPPGPERCFEGTLQIPQTYDDSERLPLKSERSFIEQVFSELNTGQPLMILAQADSDTGVYCETLKKHAEQLFGVDNVFHVFPPTSVRADEAAYFGRLAQQCRFDSPAQASWEWADALERRFEEEQELFLLVTGLENGPDEFRAELAGELRRLKEAHSSHFYLVMMGGEKLAALKYANGSISLLDLASEQRLGDLDAADLRAIQMPYFFFR